MPRFGNPAPRGVKALIVASGQSFTGWTHADALEQAKRAGAVVRDQDGFPASADGSDLLIDLFLLPSGEVIDRFDASERFGGWAGFNPPYKETEEIIVVTNPAAPRVEGYEGMVVEYRPTTRRFAQRQFKGSRDVFEWATEMRMLDDTRERQYAIYLDQQNRPLGYRLIGAGAVTGVLADPKVIFGPAVALHAPALMLLHNHPSGKLQASPEDRALTERMQKSAELLGVRMLDHVIVSREGYLGILSDQRPTWVTFEQKAAEA